MTAARKVTRKLPAVHPLDALGSPIRRQMLVALRSRPQSVGALARRFPVSRPAVSRHLRVLEQAGLVTAQHEGTRSLYTVRVAGFTTVRAFMDQFWDTALERLQELARQ